jgi:hypothetical protein
MDHLELFNRLARMARPAHAEYTPIDSLDLPLPETGLDSMDGLMLSVFYADIYGLPDSVSKELSFTTPAELIAEVLKHKTKEPISVDDAVGAVQW